ncbi:hypothetical protein [Amycolatopsis sp. cg9]|uniref:hypothetical protein n=1 Tax=Amycolatopsis sp. cg9 TaxID=3238801 RepID=UPI0035262312
MATDNRPARLALTAAVVALLLGGTGTLVQQRFPVSPPGTVHGVEVTGGRAEVHPAPEPAVPTPLTHRTGGGADIAFTGGTPRLRITAPAPSPGFAPVVITADGTRLLPAAYDTATRSIVADLPRPGRFWGGLLDLAALGRDVVPAPAPKPECAGRAASSGGVTVAAEQAAGSGGTATDPGHAAGSGSTTATPGHATGSPRAAGSGHAANSSSTNTDAEQAAGSGSSPGQAASPGGSPGRAANSSSTNTDAEQAAGSGSSPGQAASPGGSPGQVTSSGGANTDSAHAADSSRATTTPEHAASSSGAPGRAADSGGPTDPGPSQGPVWVCLTAGAGRAGVTLTSNARVPYRLAVPPGWPESAARTGRTPQRDLLWPGAAVTYEVPFARLPATLRGQADPGAALGATLAAAAHRVAVLFGSADEPAPDVTACAAAATAAHYTADRPGTDLAAEVWAALGPCHPDGGDTVRWFLAAGIGAVANAAAATGPAFAVSLTAGRAQRFTQTVEYRPKTGAATARAAGRCGAVSAVSGRHDAYRCTSGGTTYDPCFAGPEPRVACPTSATRAVLLTYAGGLPSPPQPGGTADPFLLTLADGLQCLAVAGSGYACTDGRTVLPGDVDTSSPMWTVDGRAVAKAYT